MRRATATLADSSLNSMDYRTYAEVWNLTQGMSADELRDAITLLEQEGSTDRNSTRLRMMLFSQWGAIDGRAAAEFALNEQNAGMRRGTSIMGAFSAWMKTDPAAAEAWYIANKEQFKGNSWTNTSIKSMFIQNLAKRDINTAFEQIDFTKTEERRSAVRSISRLVMDDSTRDAVIAKVQSLDDPELKHQMLRRMMNSLSYQDLETAGALLNSIDNTNESHFSTYQAEYLRGLSRSDPATALEYAANEIADDQRRENSMQNIFAQYARSDSEAALAWLDSQDVSNKDQYYQRVSSNTQWNDPEGSMQWALKIEDDNRRTNEVIKVYRSWSRQHREGASRWLATLDEESQAAILGEVGGNDSSQQ